MFCRYVSNEMKLKVVMFMCCTKMSSVINWIYSEQELFFYKRVENKLKRPAGYLDLLCSWQNVWRNDLAEWCCCLEVTCKKIFIIQKFICPIIYKRNHWTESTKKIKKISKQKKHFWPESSTSTRRFPDWRTPEEKKMISSKFRQKSFSSVSGMFRRPRTGNVRPISGKQLSEDIHRCLKLDPPFAALNQMATWGTF